MAFCLSLVGMGWILSILFSAGSQRGGVYLMTDKEGRRFAYIYQAWWYEVHLRRGTRVIEEELRPSGERYDMLLDVVQAVQLL